MRILLFGLGLLALLSGGLKFRERIRTRIGTSPYSLAELALGVIACALSVGMPEPSPLHSTVAAAIVVILVLAGVHQSRLTTAFQHKRDLSESHRLKSFMDVATASPGTAVPPPETPALPQERAAQPDKTAVRAPRAPLESRPT
jgi:hypothetical protein